MHKIPIGQLDVSKIAIMLNHIDHNANTGITDPIFTYTRVIRKEIDRAIYEYERNMNVKEGEGI